MFLEWAGTCGSEQAVVEVIGHMLNERHGFKNISFMVYGWYLYGQEKEYEGVQIYDQQFQAPSYMMTANAPNYLKSLKEREAKCRPLN